MGPLLFPDHKPVPERKPPGGNAESVGPRANGGNTTTNCAGSIAPSGKPVNMNVIAPILDAPGRTRGELAKHRAHRTFEAHRAGIILRGRHVLLDVLLVQGHATIDDVRDRVDVPTGVNPKCFGSVPGLLADAGIIERNGMVKSRRPEGHARPVTLWRLRDSDAAQAWRLAHPLPVNGALNPGANAHGPEWRAAR